MLLQLFKLQSKKYFYFSSFLLGVILSLGFDPYNIPFISLLVVGLLFKLNEQFFIKYNYSYQGFFLIGLTFGFGFFISSTYWISNALIVYGGNTKFLLPFSIILLPLVLGFFYGVMQLFNCFFWNNSNAKIFYFTVFWIIFELLRSYLFTGLPWNLICYSWSWSTNFIQVLSLIGPYGLGAMSVFCSCAIFSIKKKQSNIIIAVLGVMILFLVNLYGSKRIENYKETYLDNFDVRIVGTYINQDKKWSESTRAIINEMLSENSLTIIPETMAGLKLLKGKNLLQGYLRNEGTKYYNSIDYNGSTYDKKHLVPFGEYIPFSNFINKTPLSKYFNTTSLSKGEAKNFPSNIVPLICYEGIFPNFVKLNRKIGAKLLVNITNDSWFGKKTGPKQHFTHVKFRAIEEGLPLIRSSNMGFSGLINPLGSTVSQVELESNSYVDVKIPRGVNTFYSIYRYNIIYFLIALFWIFGYFTQILFNKSKV